MKYITMAEKVEINGLKYILSTNYSETYHETLGELKKCEAIRWYDMYLYRTQGGDCRACYADDTKNNWSI